MKIGKRVYSAHYWPVLGEGTSEIICISTAVRSQWRDGKSIDAEKAPTGTVFMHNFKQTSNGGFFYSLSTACLVSFEEKAVGHFWKSWLRPWWVQTVQSNHSFHFKQKSQPLNPWILEPLLWSNSEDFWLYIITTDDIWDEAVTRVHPLPSFHQQWWHESELLDWWSPPHPLTIAGQKSASHSCSKTPKLPPLFKSTLGRSPPNIDWTWW